jgi:hypothetical protein
MHGFRHFLSPWYVFILKHWRTAGKEYYSPEFLGLDSVEGLRMKKMRVLDNVRTSYMHGHYLPGHRVQSILPDTPQRVPVCKPIRSRRNCHQLDQEWLAGAGSRRGGTCPYAHECVECPSPWTKSSKYHAPVYPKINYWTTGELTL